MKPRVLITSAAGKTGAPATALLIDKGFPVRAFVRCEDARSEALRWRGAEIVVGDMLDAGDVARAMDGAQRAYFCAPMEPRALEAATIFAAAAQESALEAVVVMSQWLASPGHASVQTRDAWLSDRIFASLRTVVVTTINPGWFADNYMAALEPIAQFGLMPMPLGKGLNAPPSNEDIARVAANLLTEPEAHAGKTYRPTGPRLLAPQEIADVFGRVLGRKVAYVDAPIPIFTKVARALGFSDYVTAQVSRYFEDYRSNAFAVGAPTNVVREIGGSEPEDFETIARRYAARSKYAERSAGAWFSACSNLLRILATGRLDYARYEKEHYFESRRPAELAIRSKMWRASHGAPG